MFTFFYLTFSGIYREKTIKKKDKLPIVLPGFELDLTSVAGKVKILIVDLLKSIDF